MYLRKLSFDDAYPFFILNEDKEVLRYTGDEPFKDLSAAREFLECYNQYKKYGFGRWAVIHKMSQEFLGWCGLKYSEPLNEYDIGFRFFREYWNKGYATESALACLELGFNHFGINEIIGRAIKENKASIRVLAKIGMKYDREFKFDGTPGVIYKINKELYNQLH